MKFFQKRWVSIVVCLVMIVTAVIITGFRDHRISYEPENVDTARDWAEEYYTSYTRFISDIGGRLTEDSKIQISVMNAELDYSYGGICGVAVVKSVGDVPMEDAAHNMYSELYLGDKDCLLLVDVTAEEWYLLSGAELSQYVNQELKTRIQSAMDGAYDDLNGHIPLLCENLMGWYRSHLPLSDQEKISADTASSSVSFFTVIIILLVVIMFAASASRMSRRASRRWGPTVVITGRRNRTIRYDLEPDYHYPPRTDIYRRSPNNGSVERSWRLGGKR